MIRGEKTKRTQPANARNPGFWKGRERRAMEVQERRSLAELRAVGERLCDVHELVSFTPRELVSWRLITDTEAREQLWGAVIPPASAPLASPRGRPAAASGTSEK